MATVTIKDIPDKLHRQLKARALQQHRSLNSHIISVLESATAPQRIDSNSSSPGQRRCGAESADD